MSNKIALLLPVKARVNRNGNNALLFIGIGSGLGLQSQADHPEGNSPVRLQFQ